MDKNLQGQARTLSFGLLYIVVEHGNRKEMEVHVGVEDAGTTDHSLIWTESQQTKARKSRRGRKLYKGRVDKLEMEEKRQEFQEEMVRNAVTFSELLEEVGTVGTEMERNRTGAKIIEGWEQLVKDTACKVIGKKLILCNKAVCLLYTSPSPRDLSTSRMPSSA